MSYRGEINKTLDQAANLTQSFHKLRTEQEKGAMTQTGSGQT